MPRKRASAKPKPPSNKGVSRRALPRYKADNGPLSEKQMDAIDRLQPPGRTKVKQSLF